MFAIITYMTRLGDIASSFQGLALAGRGAGLRRGDWPVRIAESGDIQDDRWLALDKLREIDLVRSRRTERHLLRPYDMLVTARSGSIQLAMAPPNVFETVAGVTLLVIRARDTNAGLAHYLWYYLTSSFGRRELVKRMTVNATITSLAASAIRDIEIPLPTPHQLKIVTNLVEASEQAYTAAVEAARLRRDTVRDSVIGDIVSGNNRRRPFGGNHAADQPGVAEQAVAGR